MSECAGSGGAAWASVGPRGVAGERERKAVTWETPPGISLILEWIMKRVHKEQNSSTRTRLWSCYSY